MKYVSIHTTRKGKNYYFENENKNFASNLLLLLLLQTQSHSCFRFNFVMEFIINKYLNSNLADLN